MTEHETQELENLRHIRGAHNAIRDLQAEAAFIAKRFRKGISLIERHIISVESEMDEMTMEGGSAIETMSPELVRLIADPTLNNCPTDNKV